MKTKIFLLFFGGVIFLAGNQCRVGANTENMPEEQSTTEVRKVMVFENGGYKWVVPDPLCPFVVEIYPKVLHFGDPLYVRLNYKNTADTDAYVFAVTDFVAGQVECGTFAFHLMVGDVIIPWNIRSGFGHGYPPRLWHKVKPGEKVTRYAAFIPPFSWVGDALSDHFAGSTLLVSADYYRLPRWAKEGWEEISVSGAGGAQLVVVLNGGVETLMVASPRFNIVPRSQEEMQLLGLDKSPEERGVLKRQDIERIIPKLTPGTLQNLLKYELLLSELTTPLEEAVKVIEKKLIEQQPVLMGGRGSGLDSLLEIDEKLETHILGFLAKIEDFLKPLHEIERENLKRIPEQRNYIVMWTHDSEKIQKRLIEVFGEKFVPVGVPQNLGFGGGTEDGPAPSDDCTGTGR